MGALGSQSNLFSHRGLENITPEVYNDPIYVRGVPIGTQVPWETVETQDIVHSCPLITSRKCRVSFRTERENAILRTVTLLDFNQGDLER